MTVDPERDRSLAKLAQKAVAAALLKVTQLGAVPTGDAAALHQLRIAYKGVRYAAEILGSALPAGAVALAESAARFQKRLGEIHDLDVAASVIRRSKLLPPGDKERGLLALQGARRRAVAKYNAEPGLPAVETVTAGG